MQAAESISNLFQVSSPLQQQDIITTVVMIILLVSMQALMDFTFSCPCNRDWNLILSFCAFLAPAAFAFFALFILFTLSKCSKQNNGSISFRKVFLVSFVPAYIWIFLMFLHGDYLACLLTNWDGQYACDRTLRPECLNWCKPYSFNATTEAKLQKTTQEWIMKSKVRIV